jgi:hypothetical protein
MADRRPAVCHSRRPGQLRTTSPGRDACHRTPNSRASAVRTHEQNHAARIRLPEGAARKVSASVRRACIPDTYAASGPNREPGRILIPGDGAAGDQGAQNRPACPAMAALDACGLSVSTTSWRYGLRRTCRLVTGRSHRPRSTWPNQARLAFLAVTHRYERINCLWLEQFQIADYLRQLAGSACPPIGCRLSSSGRNRRDRTDSRLVMATLACGRGAGQGGRFQLCAGTGAKAW